MADIHRREDPPGEIGEVAVGSQHRLLVCSDGAVGGAEEEEGPARLLGHGDEAVVVLQHPQAVRVRGGKWGFTPGPPDRPGPPPWLPVLLLSLTVKKPEIEGSPQ